MVGRLADNYDLSGKTALITGGAGLLGVEHAHALLEKNASVVITDICEELSLERCAGLMDEFGPSRIFVERLDVSDENSVVQCQKTLLSKSLRVDILLNNAAVNPHYGSGFEEHDGVRLETFSKEIWEREISVGLTGAFLCSKVFGTCMASDGKGGVIVNISSDLSLISPDQRLYAESGVPPHMQPVKPVSYSVIKTGLIGLTRYLATYWVDNGVRCNALSPGGVFVDQDPDFVGKISSRIPMGRMAKKTDYREAIQFLCSDASAYMNGHNLVIDGGRSIW